MERQRSADVMKSILLEDLKDPNQLEALKTNPSDVLQKALVKAKQGAPIPDNPVYRMMVGTLGFVAILALVGAIVLAAMAKTIPEGAIALGSAAVGALAGALIPQK